MYYIYIVSCEDNTLYTGITTDVLRRMNEHFKQTEKCAKYTRSHKAKSLEALWQTEKRSTASKLEWHIKHLARQKKIELINNPQKVGELFDDEELKKSFVPVNTKDVKIKISEEQNGKTD